MKSHLTSALFTLVSWLTDSPGAQLCTLVQAHTYRHGVLHVSHGRGELAEVQLGAVDQRVDQIPALPASLHAGYLPLGTVGEHGCMVLPCGNALGKGHKRSNHAREDRRKTQKAQVEPQAPETHHGGGERKTDRAGNSNRTSVHFLVSK